MRPREPARDPRTWLPTLLGGAAALISAATLVSVTLRAPPAPVTVVQPPAPPAPTSFVPPVITEEPPLAPPAPEPTSVQLSIDVTPRYAQVYLDGVLLKHPVRRTIPRGDMQHELTVQAGGYKTETKKFSPASHMSFVIALEPLPKRSDP